MALWDSRSHSEKQLKPSGKPLSNLPNNVFIAYLYELAFLVHVLDDKSIFFLLCSCKNKQKKSRKVLLLMCGHNRRNTAASPMMSFGTLG